jgi:hypothetical protein
MTVTKRNIKPLYRQNPTPINGLAQSHILELLKATVGSRIARPQRVGPHKNQF